MQREIILIFGQTGSGKSHTARKLFQGCPRAVVAEAGFNEFSAVTFREFPQLVEYLRRIRAFDNKAVPFRVSYSPRISEQHLMFMLAEELGCCWLFLEEADRFEDPKNCPEYDEIITRGRHHGISICAVGLHPYKLPKELRRQATKLISFRQVDPSDVQWIADHVGELAYKLPELPGPPGSPPFPCLLWDAGEGSRIVSNL